MELNNYFGNLCCDDTYIEPTPIALIDKSVYPVLDELQVFRTLSNVKRTTTGPDSIPYWFWKEFADLLAPLITQIWNLSLKDSTWPLAWKEANIRPFAKI